MAVTSPGQRGRIDREAVRAGALVAIAICLPVALLAQVVVDEDADPTATAGLLYFLVLAGFSVGGWFAARRAVDTPYSSGAVAALVAFVAIQAVSIVSLTVRGEPVPVGGIVFNGLLAYGAGLLGATVVARQRTA